MAATPLKLADEFAIPCRGGGGAVLREPGAASRSWSVPIAHGTVAPGLGGAAGDVSGCLVWSFPAASQSIPAM